MAVPSALNSTYSGASPFKVLALKLIPASELLEDVEDATVVFSFTLEATEVGTDVIVLFSFDEVIVLSSVVAVGIFVASSAVLLYFLL